MASRFPLKCCALLQGLATNNITAAIGANLQTALLVPVASNNNFLVKKYNETQIRIIHYFLI